MATARTTRFPWGQGEWLLVVIVGVAMAMVGVVGYGLWRSASDDKTMRLHTASMQARLIEDQFTQMLHLTQVTLEGLSDRLSEPLKPQRESDNLTQTVRRMVFLRSLVLVSNERVVASSLPEHVGLIWRHDEGLPKRDGPGPASYLRMGLSLQGRDWSTAQPMFDASVSSPDRSLNFIPLSYESAGRKGTWRWMAALNPDFFVNRIAALLEDDTTEVRVLRDDGVLLMSSKGTEQVGLKVLDDDQRQRLQQQAIGQDAAQWMAFRASAQYPVTVMVRLDAQRIQAQWWDQSQRTVALLVGGLMLWLGLGVLLWQRMRKNEESEQRLSQSRSLIAQVFENSTNGIVITDGHGQVMAVNSRFERTCGLCQQDMQEQNLGHCIRQANGQPLAEAFEALKRGSGTWAGEVVIQSPRMEAPSSEWLTLSVVNNEDGHEPVLAVFQDLNRERQHEQLIQRLSQAVEQSPTSIIITDLNSVIEYVNPHFYRITGYSPAEVIGRKPNFLCSGLTAPSTYADLWATLHKGLTWEGEFINKHRNGDICYQRAVVAPIRNAQGEATHYLAVELDVTEQHRQSVLLEAAHQAAEAANVAKSNFLANMSHEIRTPMNGIIGMSELLLDSVLGAEQRDHAQTIGNSARSLLRIINDLLDLSKIEAGQWHLEQLPFSPAEVARDVVNLLTPVVQDKPFAFTHDLSEVEQVSVLGDANRLRQILLNLLDNAIKFTEQGRVHLAMRCTPGKGQAMVLRCEVSDTGIGMSPQVLNQLFKPFYQGDASMSRRFGGTGLGLSICRRMAELMGGSLHAESQAGEGSRFILTLFLPRAPEHATVAPAPEPSTPAFSFSGLRVLLVEDNLVNQKVAQALLKRMGCVVTSALNGQEALSALQEQPVDLVFMDCQMPLMDGLEATRRIREGQAGEHLRQVPIVAMTAHAMQGDREKCLMAGMNEYLTKPVRMSELHWCLTSALGTSTLKA